MYLKERQGMFDDVKWYDSISAGNDKCGSYVFCGKCEKQRRYPCARAEYRYKSGHIRLAIVRRYHK